MNVVEKKVQSFTLVQAVRDALRLKLAEDPDTLILGEDVGKNGGVFRATEDLQKEFGSERVIDTPLSEAGIIGTSVGMAVNGCKPIAEIQFLGFIYPAYEHIMTHVSRLRAKTRGHYTVPMVIRAPYGAGVRAPEIHSDSTEALFTHMPGLKVVCPSDPYDAKGLLISAIEDPDPVLFLESMRNYRAFRMDVPTGKYYVEIGKGKKVQEGTDITLIAWGAMVPVAMKAAAEAEKQNITCDIIDLRTLSPIDRDIIAESVQKTGRAVIIHEAHGNGGLGADILSIINDTSFLYLKAPIGRVTGFDVPVPFFSLEEHYIPTPKRVMKAIQDAIHF
ncbi:alpha-ketoacid dehydrogenase subunit beta [Bacillus sp. 1P06AnD]|uniref:alpha-ketoacid dehydrogenase subunit beta n=1 Tax=Bacillus sp. 1P06AnD TaxID=3132208 RepID=UPI0039A2F077